MRNTALFIAIAATILAGCLKDDLPVNPYDGFSPDEIGDGWELSTPSAEGLDSAKLDQIYRDLCEDDEAWLLKSLLVFRNGKLVGEHYFKDEADQTKRAPVWSCTKQVNGIITGIALDQGYIEDINDPIGKYIPEHVAKYPDKSGITIRHLLTMTSGLDFDNGTQSDIFRQHKTENSIDYVLGLDLLYPPGTHFYYKDGDPQVMSGILQAATGKTLDEYGKEVLLAPLGVENYEWVRYSDGITLGAWGILTTPRELAKVAQCVADSGRWDNKQIIPKAWWEEMLSPHTPNAHDDAAFGYFWWSIPSEGWYYMWGHGGQFAFFKPSSRLLVMTTAYPTVDYDFAYPLEEIRALANRIESAIN